MEKFQLAEGRGVEPLSPCGRRFSKPVEYHYPNPPVLKIYHFNFIKKSPPRVKAKGGRPGWI